MEEKTDEYLIKIQELYSRKHLIPVVGSGISVPLHLPDWANLIKDTADYFKLAEEAVNKIKKLISEYKYADAADEIVAAGVMEIDIQRYIAVRMKTAKQCADYAKINNYQDLSKMEGARFITTNYDMLLNDIAGARSLKLTEIQDKLNDFILPKFDRTVIPLHGEISDPASIVLTGRSYKELYANDRYEGVFDRLRTSYTFLFMGFSFDDEYFKDMFRTLVKCYKAQHFILFDKSMKEQNPDKIRRLEDEFGIVAIYYDKSAGTHEEAIHELLEKIIRLKDPDVRMDALEVLPEKASSMTADEDRLVKEGRGFIANEEPEKLYALYGPVYNAADFRSHTVEFKSGIICGIAWYYGYIRDDEKALETIDAAISCDDALGCVKEKFTIMYGQILWNLFEYDRAIDILEKYNGKDDKICGLLLDVVKVFKRFMQKKDKDRRKVYEEEPWSREEERERKKCYEKFIAAYINPDTYNLLGLTSYKNAENQQIAYYWLGIAAGQLFHEHQDAAQYLLRAYEITPQLAVCEELANNYLAIGIRQVRYDKHAVKHRLDRNALLKAKIRFQYIMNATDQAALNSFYERSGAEFLRTLYYLENWFEFEQFYEKCKDIVNTHYEITILKAEADLAFKGRLDDDIVLLLKKEDAAYFDIRERYADAARFVLTPFRDTHGAAFRLHPDAESILRGILLKVESDEELLLDERIQRIFLDTVELLHDAQKYEEYKQKISGYIIDDFVELGYEDALYGRMQEQERKLNVLFGQNPDISVFAQLKKLYIRTGQEDKFIQLFESAAEEPPDDMYNQPDFYMQCILCLLEHFGDKWRAISFYGKYRDRFERDAVRKKETEEILKIQVADYNGYKERIEWNRYMMPLMPEEAKAEYYMSILKLYVANMKYAEAEAVLTEMKDAGIAPKENFDQLTAVCIRKQKNKYYIRNGAFYFAGYNARKHAESMEHNTLFKNLCRNASAYEVAMPVKNLMYLLYAKREEVLKSFKKIYLMYAGIINLQRAMWDRENAFFRMIHQWIQKADNVELAAPDFGSFCNVIDKMKHKDTQAERIQLEIFCEGHPDVARGWT